jgi:hypothetical protein
MSLTTPAPLEGVVSALDLQVLESAKSYLENLGDVALVVTQTNSLHVTTIHGEIIEITVWSGAGESTIRLNAYNMPHDAAHRWNMDALVLVLSHKFPSFKIKLDTAAEWVEEL